MSTRLEPWPSPPYSSLHGSFSQLGGPSTYPKLSHEHMSSLACLPSLSLTLFAAPGDDLALCLRAACWLAPRFRDLASPTSGRQPVAAAALPAAVTDGAANSPAADSHGSGAASQAASDPSSAASRATGTTVSAGGGGAPPQDGAPTATAMAVAQDEPLQLLLELGAARLGAGVDGIHKSLSLMAGALGGGALKSMRLRRAFASSLRAHLATVQVDSVFRFEAPTNLVRNGGGGGGALVSPGRLALPPMLSWASFRKYTATMWVRLDPHEGGGGGAATLFRFRNGEGVGVEATLSAAVAAAGGGGGRKESPRPQQLQGRREIVVTTYQRSNGKSFAARCKFGPQAEAVHLGGGGVGEGVRQGGWRFVAVSHGQPYVKRTGRLRVSVDGAVVLETDLQYPPATGQGAKDPMSRCDLNPRVCSLVRFCWIFFVGVFPVVSRGCLVRLPHAFHSLRSFFRSKPECFRRLPPHHITLHDIVPYYTTLRRAGSCPYLFFFSTRAENRSTKETMQTMPPLCPLIASSHPATHHVFFDGSRRHRLRAHPRQSWHELIQVLLLRGLRGRSGSASRLRGRA